MRYLLRLPILTVVAAAIALAFGASAIVAQTPQPSPGATPGAEMPHPVAIHQGTCQSPIAEPVTDLGQTAPFGSDSEPIGQTEQPQVLYASGTFDGSLEDLANSPHVIAVHQSPDEFGTLIGCGEIAGFNSDGTMVIGIFPAPGGQTFAGLATLESAEDQVQIGVFVLPNAAVPQATPQA